MNIYEFQEAVNKEDFKKILEILEPDIKESEKYNTLIKNNRIQEPEYVLETLEVTSGLYGVFIVAKAILESKEEEEKNKQFLALKDEKTTVARAEAIASVSDWTRLRAIAEAYAKMNEKNSSICQSILSYFKEVYNRSEGEYDGEPQE